MSDTKFKIGDRVSVIWGDNPIRQNDATITEIKEGDTPFDEDAAYVIFDNGNANWFNYDKMVLLVPEPEDPAPSPRSPREQADDLLKTFASIQALVDSNPDMGSSNVSIIVPGIALDVIKELAIDDELNVTASSTYGNIIFTVQNDHSQHCNGVVKWSAIEAL